MFENIESQMRTLYGPNYDLSFTYNIDSSRHATFPGYAPIEDPYGSLHQCVVFGASGKRVTSHYWPHGFIGVYKNGTIIWHSDTLIVTALGEDLDLYGTTDLNNDGKVDILIMAYRDARNTGGELWMFSWDGQAGMQINDTTAGGVSALIGSQDSFQLVDDDGDGVVEIHVQDELSDSINVFSWNGQKYVKLNRLQRAVTMPSRHKGK